MDKKGFTIKIINSTKIIIQTHNYYYYYIQSNNYNRASLLEYISENGFILPDYIIFKD